MILLFGKLKILCVGVGRSGACGSNKEGFVLFMKGIRGAEKIMVQLDL